MSSLHPSELDSAATDSVASSPRSDIHPSHDPRVRFMCSFGGKILPRPHDNLLRYVGGDTRIVAVHRATTFSALLIKLSKLSGIPNVSLKYQLPNEDLDSLISVTTDEDVENMIEENDRVAQNQNPRSARLRLFLFPKGEESRASSISSLLDGSANRENWFFDALNSGPQLERGRSEASSIVSEVPDYLFGLDNSEESNPQPREPKLKNRPVLQDNVSASDPGSPAPVVSSPYFSTSSTVPTVASIPDLPPVKTKLDNPENIPRRGTVEVPPEPVETQVMHPSGYSSNPVMHYVPEPHFSEASPVQQMPVYYLPAGTVPPGNVPVQPVQFRAPQYVQQYQLPAGQVPVIYHQQGFSQVYSGAAMRPVAGMDPYEAGRVGVAPDGLNQPVYYGVRNHSTGMVPGMLIPAGDDRQRAGWDPNTGRFSQSS